MSNARRYGGGGPHAWVARSSRGTCRSRAARSRIAELDRSYVPRKRHYLRLRPAWTLDPGFRPVGNTADYKWDQVSDLTDILKTPSSSVTILQLAPNSAPVGSTVRVYGTGFSTNAAHDPVAFDGTAASSRQLRQLNSSRLFRSALAAEKRR